MIGTYIMKQLRRSSPIVLQKSVLTSCKAEFAFFLSEFSFTNIHNSQNSRGRGRLSLYIFFTTFTRFTNTQTLAGSLLQKPFLFTSSPKPDLAGKDMVSVLFFIIANQGLTQRFYWSKTWNNGRGPENNQNFLGKQKLLAQDLKICNCIRISPKCQEYSKSLNK